MAILDTGLEIGGAAVASTPEIKFGTDGWRGLIAVDFTFDNVRRVSGAIAAYILKHEDAAKGVVVGYDTRFLSRRFAEAASGVLAKAGIPVKLANDYVPTPAVSLHVKQSGAAGGVMITSSHNPWNWNGVKFKANFGGSATPAIMKIIEEELRVGATPHGTRASIEEINLTDPYIEAVCTFAGTANITRGGFKFAVDSMHGSGRGILARIFSEAGVPFTAIRQDVNPLFPGINPEPILPHVALLQEAVVREKCNAGLVTDGDAFFPHDSFLQQSDMWKNGLGIDAREKRVNILPNGGEGNSRFRKDPRQNPPPGTMHGINRKFVSSARDIRGSSKCANRFDVWVGEINLLNGGAGSMRSRPHAKFLLNDLHDRRRCRAPKIRLELNSVPIPGIMTRSNHYPAGRARLLHVQRHSRSGNVIMSQFHRDAGRRQHSAC